ncbi:hypothetical protein FRB90_003576 [Tulasnella sp. 427]|nr:hypothetical protein FRB90_003576 [Tulasnella sp. 427]
MGLRSITGRVQQHFTKVYPSLVTERVLHIPLQPGACWKDLPEDLLDPNWEHRPPNKSSYKRLNNEDFFPTSTCNVDPVSRFGHVLHPTQKRVITLREYARAQGFPDAFVFWTTTPQAPVRELFKQVGNAVPVPLAAALGESVAKAIIADFSDD